MVSWNKITYPRRLFLWLMAYSLIMAGSFVIFQNQREKDFKTSALDSQLQLINTYILNELEEGREPSAISLGEFGSFGDLRLSVISRSGEVVYDNTLDSLPRSNHLDRSEIRDALRSSSGYAVRRHSHSTGEYYFYSARKGDNGYIVRTAVPYTVSLTDSLRADYGFLWVMGLISLVMCLLGFFATRRLGLHITRLKRFSENVEKGMTISDTEPFPHDELGEISNHIVRLYARLQKADADRDAEHRAALREQAEKQRIKKQLTNNINHELKTPVASIQLCLETLLTRDSLTADERRIFLQRSLKASARLRKLLDDVSLITRMDDGGQTIQTAPVDLGEIIRESVDAHSLPALEKGMKIIDVTDGRLPVVGNAPLLESVFDNLLDNAIAYSGGSTVRIRMLDADSGSVRIELSDDGTGVPEEHLPHIFERFYRIDKGRSRANGGTGLGLSIVRNAVLMHGGSIVARNLRTGGLSFVICLPAAPDFTKA